MFLFFRKETSELAFDNSFFAAFLYVLMKKIKPETKVSGFIVYTYLIEIIYLAAS